MTFETQDLIAFFVLIIGVVSTWISLSRSGIKDQREVDKHQDIKISKLQTKTERLEERTSGIFDKINFLSLRQTTHEDKTEVSLKELASKIEDMPRKIVELLNATKK